MLNITGIKPMFNNILTTMNRYEKDEFENGICPKCGSDKTTYLARITGYLTTNVNKWNTGKMAEFKDRVRHTGSDRESLSEKGVELQMD